MSKNVVSVLMLIATTVYGAPPADTINVGTLPVAVASFGAAVQDGWIYVLGGHVGLKHAHSTANLSSAFMRKKLGTAEKWETLPGRFPLQSVSLVSDGMRLYRIGGMTARNDATEPEDLHSVDEVAVFDPRERRWSELPRLPQRRSSHDSVIIDGTLYVSGGWCLGGSSDEGEWLTTTYALDLRRPTEWVEMPETPFKRRAVTVAGYSGRLFVIGGLDEKGDRSHRVDVLDLRNARWFRAPDLPSNGFGMSAFNVGRDIYASGMDGVVLRLSPGLKQWESIANLTESRFFHRLIPMSGGSLVFAGGANRDGHLASIELLELGQPKPAVSRKP